MSIQEIIAEINEHGFGVAVRQIITQRKEVNMYSEYNLKTFPLRNDEERQDFVMEKDGKKQIWRISKKKHLRHGKWMAQLETGCWSRTQWHKDMGFHDTMEDALLKCLEEARSITINEKLYKVAEEQGRETT